MFVYCWLIKKGNQYNVMSDSISKTKFVFYNIKGPKKLERRLNQE